MTISASRGRPAAFLDRDGVINVDHGYTWRREDLVFTPSALEGIRLLNDAGYLVIVVSNQSGVARGFFGTEDVERFHRAMEEALNRSGARIDAFYYCAFHPAGSVAEFARDHEDRKPNAGMLRRAIADWSIDRLGSFMIGDKNSDIEAAERAGVVGIRIAANVGDLAATIRKAIGRVEPSAASGKAS